MNNLDPKDVLGSTGMLAKQCRQIWQEVKTLEFPSEYRACQNIILCGMGGSAYGGYVAASLFKDQLSLPLISNNDYSLPKFAGPNSLVILSSYSGSTEEILSCFNLAKEKGCKIVALTTGSKLSEGLVFEPRFNPSGQPRLGTGYMVLGLIALLNRLGFLNISDEEAEKAILELEQNLGVIEQKGKNLAEKFFNFIPVIISAEFLSGNGHILRNQINETAKSFSTFSYLPELNHHLMEGLKNPEDKKLKFLFINSSFYSDKLKKRVELTRDVVEKNNVGLEEYQALGFSKLSQMLNVLSFGGYLSLYLAYLYKQDPSVIPWVDYFKKQLEK